MFHPRPADLEEEFDLFLPSPSDDPPAKPGSDDDVAGSVSEPEAAPVARPARVRRGPGPRVAGRAVYLLIVSLQPWFPRWAPPGHPLDAAPPEGGDFMVGALYGRWEFSTEASDPETEYMATLARRASQAATLSGYLFYTAELAVKLVERCGELHWLP